GPRADRQRLGEEAKSGSGEARARQTSSEPNQERLDDELLGETMAARSERRAHGQLGGPSLDLPEHERGDVGAGDEENQSHRDERRDEGGTGRAQQGGAKR